MAAMNDAQYEALVEASRAEQSQEQAEFVAQIREYFPDGKQNMAVATFEFLLKVAYLHGQRDLLIETIEKQASRVRPT